MLGWKEIVQDYIVKHSNRIKETTRPLLDHFGIGYFTYHRIDNQGNYTVLVDRPEWAEHYVGEKIYLNDPYLRHPSVYQSGICLVESQGSKDYVEKLVRAGKKVLNIDSGAMLINKEVGYVEFFGFFCNSELGNIKSLYLNHTKLLHSFGAHFKEQMAPVLTKMVEDGGGPLLSLKGADFLCEEPVCPAISPMRRLAYYKDLGVKEIEGVEKLSSQEIRCLKCLVEGMSAKESGKELGLSSRTVEYYLENIKNKLSLWTKQELIKVAKALNEVGLLP